jgi:thiosulfate/3-mercaptopyruvate sulfurtransferase
MYPSSFVVWYTLKAHGIERVSVLDGGLAAWKNAGYRLEQGNVEEGSESDGREPPALRLREERIASLSQIRENLSQRKPTQLLDARPADRFYGRVPEPREGMMAGNDVACCWRNMSTIYTQAIFLAARIFLGTAC